MYVEAGLYNLVQPELEMGESLLWAGQPAPGRFVLQSLPLAGFGLVWTAFVANFVKLWYGLPKRNVSGPYGLFGLHGILASLFFIPFVAIGLGMLLSPLWRYVVAKRTVYAMTDRRVLIIEGRKSRRVRSYGAKEIGYIERKERAHGTGDLTFARKPTKDDEGHPSVEEVKLLGISEVRSVENLLRETFIR